MGTISDKLTYLTQTKEAIKNKIALYSVDISTGDTFRSYVDKIEDLIEFYANEPLPYIKRTLNNNGSNLNVYESPFIKIYATDHNSYTIDEWIEVVKTDNHPNPLGLDIKALGQHFVILFFMEPMPNYIGIPGTDVTGNNTTKGGANATKLNNLNWNNNAYQTGLRHSVSYYTYVTSTTPSLLKNPDDTTATVTKYKNTFILGSPNTPYTWTITEGCGHKSTITTEPQKDILRAEAIYAQTEWLRHRASIIATDSNGDITTNLPDGRMADRVDIVTDNGEMYFKIIVNENDSSQDVQTNNLAKYNTHNFVSSYSPQAVTGIIDQIYNDQKANGINMNSGLDSNDTLRVLTPGSKGTEAYVFQGKWRIITPILSYCNKTYAVDKNMVDSPIIYYWKNVIQPKFETMGIHNVQLINETWGRAYSLNITLINSITAFLRSSIGGLYSNDDIPVINGNYIWCSSSTSNNTASYCTILTGYESASNRWARYTPMFGFNLEPLIEPVIEFDAYTQKVTITAESGMDVYYTIRDSNQTNTEITLNQIYQNNSNIKKYTGPFTIPSSYAHSGYYHFIVSAAAVKNNRISTVSCEYFDDAFPVE